MTTPYYLDVQKTRRLLRYVFAGSPVYFCKKGIRLKLASMSRQPRSWAFVIPALVSVFAASLGTSAAEERTLSMFNIHTKDTVTVTFKKDGKFIPEGLKQLNHFMRDWRRNLEITMDPALIDLIWELHEELGSKQPVHLICGYRSGATNEMLRRTVGGQAQNSRHITGQAADLVFPDVPIKQLRYSALVRERGGVGFYPLSGIPFVHVDTGNVRHWPGIARPELAVLFPSGRSRHLPSDGRPITKEDYRLAMARLKSAGAELPWVVAGTKAAPRVMTASLTDSSPAPKIETVSLSPAAPDASSGASASISGHSSSEEQAFDEGDEQDDETASETAPLAFLLTEGLLAVEDTPAEGTQPAGVQKLTWLLAPQSDLAPSDLDRPSAAEALAEAKQLSRRSLSAIAALRRRASAKSVVASVATENRTQ